MGASISEAGASISEAQHCVSGPAGVVFTPDELLVIWAHLTRIADTENGSIRRKIEAYLESKEFNVNGS